MAVGAGSIKRASKLNADAESKKTVEAVAESVPVQETEAKAPAKKATTAKTTKTTAKSTTAKTTTTKKAPAKKAAEKPVEVATTVESSVITNIDPVVLDVVLGKKTKTNKACHLTEDMPIHLL
jgi:hypothetical protein